nr:MAG TPA: hypothetical protein [Caudoviricetes sp.]
MPEPFSSSREAVASIFIKEYHLPQHLILPFYQNYKTVLTSIILSCTVL